MLTGLSFFHEPASIINLTTHLPSLMACILKDDLYELKFRLTSGDSSLIFTNPWEDSFSTYLGRVVNEFRESCGLSPKQVRYLHVENL